MGTPEFAAPSLRALAATCDLIAVVTQPDRPRGRGQSLSGSPIARLAQELQVTVLKPENLADVGVRDQLAALAPDLFAVVAFGAILSSALLAVPRLGSLNLHGSLLPEYRGASPVQRALWDGRAGTGVTTLWMDEGIDTGDLVLQRWEPITAEDDAGTLAARLAELGAPLLARSVLLAHSGEAPRLTQDRAAGSYARKLTKRDGIVDWSRDVITVWNRQRAVTPWPGASTAHHGRHLLLRRTRPVHLLPDAGAPGTVLEVRADGIVVACGSGALLVSSVVPEGRGQLGAADWARGARLQSGDHLEAAREAHV
ncbi:MAG TPA: methionyl-tRNA formyltransferase [Candidatus Limnocylindria bacterium]|nr:methionyl-tRNA formyltransferase [Candidatus Limnocylindria bacterium]